MQTSSPSQPDPEGSAIEAESSDSAALRTRLLEEQAATTSRIDAMSRDVDLVMEAATLVATDDEHDPDGATLAFERARLSALVQHARAHLVDLTSAVQRVDDGSYGVCTACGRQIAPARLSARPTASTCIACASAHARA